ncbi:DUF4328 domain-containing protein [Streptomyces sp. 2.9]|uniref:DUF4328 domain-containing protein n=1 Tax=Streptomyces tritrimontium TaxID=3406573 RepID=UPI003BB540FF
MSLSTPSQSPQSAHVLQSPQGLATAATALLSVGAAVDLFSSGVSLYTWNLMKDFVGAATPSDPVDPLSDDLASADSLSTGADLVQAPLYLATGLVFILWFHRVRCNGQVFRPDGFSQSAGWAIGGWFVPLANFFFPYRTARETWEASTQNRSDGSFRRVSGAPVVAWWVMFIASCLLTWGASRKYRAAETTEAIRAADLFAAVTDLTSVAAALLAVVFVRRLTAMQHTKATQGPNAAA